MCFNNKTYKIKQKLQCEEFFLPLKIIEIENYIYCISGKFFILKYINNKYEIFKEVGENYNNFDMDIINGLYLKNDEIAFQASYSLLFFNIKNYIFSYKINNLNEKNELKYCNSLILLNKNELIIAYINKFYVIDYLNHQVVSKYFFNYHKALYNIKKLSNNNIIIQFVNSENKKDNLEIYDCKRRKIKLIKKLITEKINLFIEYDKDNLVVYIEDYSHWSSRSLFYIKIIKLNEFQN